MTGKPKTAGSVEFSEEQYEILVAIRDAIMACAVSRNPGNGLYELYQRMEQVLREAKEGVEHE